MVKDRRRIAEFINLLEERYPVAEWKMADMKLWPLFRIRLAFAFYAEDLHKAEKTIEKKRLSETIKLNLTGVLEFFRLFFYCITNRPDYFFSGNKSHRIAIEKIWYNRFFGPLVDLNGLTKRSWVHFEQNLHTSKKDLKPAGHIFTAPLLLSVFLKFPRKAPTQHTPMIEKVLDEVQNFAGDARVYLNKNSFIREANLIYNSSIAYRRLFKIIKPKAVFTLCYYSNPHLAINEAANSLNIPCVDIQHGSQGENHVAYGKWRNLPKDGYRMFPSIFWNWDSKSSASIENWCEKLPNRTFIGGNIWMRAWQDANWINRYFNSLSSHSITKPVILYSLQPANDPIPDFLIQLVKASKDHYQWVFRLHPRQLGQTDELNDIIRGNGLGESVLDLAEAYKYPLPFLLKHTVVHITQWSSVVMEAHDYGIPSLVIHQNGYSMFGESYPDLKYLGINIFTPEECLDWLFSVRTTSGKEFKTESVSQVWEKFLTTLS